MILQIRHNSPVPIYKQLVEEIEKHIKSGILKSNDSLPPIRQLAKQIDVNVNTIAKAYQELERKGIVISNGRKGTFIKEYDSNDSRIKEFEELILKLVKDGLGREEIEHSFHKSISQIFI